MFNDSSSQDPMKVQNVNKRKEGRKEGRKGIGTFVLSHEQTQCNAHVRREKREMNSLIILLALSQTLVKALREGGTPFAYAYALCPSFLRSFVRFPSFSINLRGVGARLGDELCVDCAIYFA